MASPPAFTLGRGFSSGIWGQSSTVKSPLVEKIRAVLGPSLKERGTFTYFLVWL